jgi:hypothetical protein
MASCQSSVDADMSDNFFERCGLPRESWSRCWDLARHVFPNEEIQEANPQGYCSYTLCIGSETILQFRPQVHKLEIKISAAAQSIYGKLAPQTELLDLISFPKSCLPDETGQWPGQQQALDEAVVIDDGCYRSHTSLHVYSMARIPGMPVAELQNSPAKCSAPAVELRRQREGLVSEFARFIAIGWKSARPVEDPVVCGLRGRVGSSIKWRLEEMRAHLPARFQPFVGSILEHLDDIKSLPWVLTHGDVVPANMMVQTPEVASSGEVVLSGFVDWAEAEYLPFGVGIYGLGALLGEPDCNGCFRYYHEAKELREYFWARLQAEIPELGLRSGPEGFRKKVEAAHALGVLLWHGIAFDNGRLDRVIDESKPDDADEVRILDLFFFGDEKPEDEQVAPTRLDTERNVLAKPFDLGKVVSCSCM